MEQLRHGVVLIGDLIGSRRAPDRQVLHDNLVHVLSELTDALELKVPARPTVGDEFQSSFPSIEQAVEFVYRFRMRSEPDWRARFGLGVGAYVLLDRNVLIEDGEAHWNARAAIQRVKARESTQLARSRCSLEPLDSQLEAALLSVDVVLGAWTARSWRVLEALVAGRTQGEVASKLGISSSAVSQRVRADQIVAMKQILETLYAT